MAALTTIVDLVHPSDNAAGVFLSDTIWVIFDQEIDHGSVTNGSFFIEGPDTDSFFGEGFGLNLPRTSESTSADELESPGFRGIVQGNITFEKIQVASLDPYSGFDESGIGTAWRTKAVITPTYPLAINTKYTVYLVGDEDISDTNLTGIRTRSVFDTFLGANIGDGEATFVGTFTGNAGTDTYHIKCSTAGAAGVAKFTWFKDSDPLNIRGPILSHRFSNILLEHGIYVDFGDGDFVLDDEYAVIVKKPTVYSGNVVWTFTTGAGSVDTLPTTTSTTVLGTQPGTTTSTTTTTVLSLLSATPADDALNIEPTTNQIVLTFDQTIDPSTVTADSITVAGQPAHGDESLLATREIFKDITVSGSQIILDI